uniref:AAA+ ATPase domain-containing protein n=1 Tax=viral metagenome TaxID=1070528 RepID=A0A6C0I3C6_9ZZZZ
MVTTIWRTALLIIPFFLEEATALPKTSRATMQSNRLGLYMLDTDTVLKYKNVLQKTEYNELLNKINNHQVSNIYFTNTLDSVISEKEEGGGDVLTDFSLTPINPFITNTLVDKAVANKVKTYFLHPPSPTGFDQVTNSVGSLFEGFIIPFFFIYFLISLFRSASGAMGGGGGMLGMPGQKDINADKLTVIKANISLSSFAGSAEIFEECTEVVSYLKNDTMYKLAGAEIPRGILLEGPPGTGKTLLAKAIASEADANFIAVAASEFVELFVGMGAAKIRNIFKKARENKPCILFIDEIDAVGRQRGAGNTMGGNDEREQTLNQLLAEMDGFADNEGILIMAATNRKDVLDAALLRPGRFDRLLSVPLPDRESRKEIFKVHSKNKQLSPSINFELVSELSNGFSGAQIKNLLNEAAIFAARRNETVIQDFDLMNAVDKLIVGLVKRNDTRSEDARYRIAVHETGHALLTLLFKEYFELKKVTMQSTYNGAGGYTLFNELQNISESGLYTKDLLKKRLIIGMGGKAAENIVYGDMHVSLGAVQDLKSTNSLAQRMIGNYGMGNELETFYNENINSERSPFSGRNVGYSEKVRDLFDKESIMLVNEAYSEAIRLLLDNKDVMDKIVGELMIRNTLYGKDLVCLVKNG